MHLDWTHVTLLRSLAGGVLIGLAAALLILLNGRIAGISGILGALLTRTPAQERAWRWCFLIGLLLAAPAWQLLHALPPATISAGPLPLIVSGLLVGIGTRYATGCTSGHGVCGMARAAPRSLIATATFMLSGFLAVYLLRHVFFHPGV